MSEVNPGLEAIVAIVLYVFPVVAIVAGIVWSRRERRRFERKAAQPGACTFCGGKGWKHARDGAGRPVTTGAVEHGPYVFEDCAFCDGTGAHPHHQNAGHASRRADMLDDESGTPRAPGFTPS